MKPLPEPLQVRLCLAAIAAAFTGSAALSLRAAMQHMAELGEICGTAAPHCGWCLAAAGFLVMGLTAGWAAGQPSRRAAPAS